MRNFLFASGDFPDVVFALPYKAQANFVGKASGCAEIVDVGTRRDSFPFCAEKLVFLAPSFI